ncbi:hypothetical protein H1W37_00720 [Stappia taiwanensis]|uniref:Uncharacterized protein n=1 Tax=Stappia taiwanensis TaxID=992267 RepID=A0A838XNF7_9HYPH|nr:hypothetical protein [Stappia taiwanensis]MBA4610156.1 hypothetical protein [Stappia taiwanensis]GGE77304.1 hypothetical protein GCM10007285_01430 [Stappia taiwanensis]
MKAFLSAVVVMAAIGIGAWAVLNKGFDYSSSAVYTTETPGAVRLSPGDGTRPAD